MKKPKIRAKVDLSENSSSLIKVNDRIKNYSTTNSATRSHNTKSWISCSNKSRRHMIKNDPDFTLKNNPKSHQNHNSDDTYSIINRHFKSNRNPFPTQNSIKKPNSEKFSINRYADNVNRNVQNMFSVTRTKGRLWFWLWLVCLEDNDGIPHHSDTIFVEKKQSLAFNEDYTNFSSSLRNEDLNKMIAKSLYNTSTHSRTIEKRDMSNIRINARNMINPRLGPSYNSSLSDLRSEHNLIDLKNNQCKFK